MGTHSFSELAEEQAGVGRTILVADDEESIVKLLTKILTARGHNVIGCSNGVSALEILRKDGVDLLITDLRMPKMGGLELVRKVREINNDLGIVIITGHGTMEAFLEALREGINDFILKPIDRQQLLSAVDKVLEKRSLTENLMARTQQLLQAEKMATVGLLSTGIAHEINNPNTFIRTNLQLLSEYLKRLKPRLENIEDEKNYESVRAILEKEFPELISEALKGTERIQKIVSGIKHYAHMGEDSFEDNVDIREVIKHSVSLVRTKLRRNIDITENYLNIREIKGHFSKLEQVFVNLLINAGDAISEKLTQRREAGDREFMGLIDVSATVIEGDETGDGRSPDYLVLTFYDNGVGIPDGKIKKVFDPFFTTKTVGFGTGMGLYISYEIIKQHGGEITVQSDEGEGTSFIIKLPVEGAVISAKSGEE